MLTHLKENATSCRLNKLLQCFNLFFIFVLLPLVCDKLPKSLVWAEKFQTRTLTWLISPLEASDKEIQRPNSLVPIHAHTAGEMACKCTFSPPKVPKVQHATRAWSPLGRRAPHPFSCPDEKNNYASGDGCLPSCSSMLPHQSWSNTIYSCVCDVFTSTHYHVCVQRSEVDKPAFLITFHMIFLKLSHWTCSWPIQMNWLTGVPPGSSCPPIPSVRLKVHNAMPICSKT